MPAREADAEGFQLAVFGHGLAASARTVDVRHLLSPSASPSIRSATPRGFQPGTPKTQRGRPGGPTTPRSAAQTPTAATPRGAATPRSAPPSFAAPLPRSNSVPAILRPASPRLTPRGSVGGTPRTPRTGRPRQHSAAPAERPAEVTLRKEEADAIPNWQITNMSAVPKGALCCICQDELVLLDVVKRLPGCQHLFHRHCIDRWLVDCRPTCPVCVKHVTPAWDPIQALIPPAVSSKEAPRGSSAVYQPRIVTAHSARVPLPPSPPGSEIRIRGRAAPLLQYASRSAAVAPSPNVGRSPRPTAPWRPRGLSPRCAHSPASGV